MVIKQTKIGSKYLVSTIYLSYAGLIVGYETAVFDLTEKRDGELSMEHTSSYKQAMINHGKALKQWKVFSIKKG